jgi:hypothetical protein
MSGFEEWLPSLISGRVWGLHSSLSSHVCDCGVVRERRNIFASAVFTDYQMLSASLHTFLGNVSQVVTRIVTLDVPNLPPFFTGRNAVRPFGVHFPKA